MSEPTAFVFNSSAGVLSGTAALQSIQTVQGNTSSNGNVTPFNGISYYLFNPSNYTTIAKQDDGYTYWYSQYEYAPIIKAGNSGAIGSSSTHGGYGNFTTTGAYVVSSDTASSLLVTFFEKTDKNIQGTIDTQTVFRIDTNGSITPVSYTQTHTDLGVAYESYTFTFQ